MPIINHFESIYTICKEKELTKSKLYSSLTTIKKTKFSRNWWIANPARILGCTIVLLYYHPPKWENRFQLCSSSPVRVRPSDGQTFHFKLYSRDKIRKPNKPNWERKYLQYKITWSVKILREVFSFKKKKKEKGKSSEKWW